MTRDTDQRAVVNLFRTGMSALGNMVITAVTFPLVTRLGDTQQAWIEVSILYAIGKAALQEDASEPGQETAPAQAEKSSMTDFKPYVGRKRKSGTGCVTEINDHLFEGRYSPKWPDGKKHARNVYAHTREECEERTAHKCLPSVYPVTMPNCCI